MASIPGMPRNLVDTYMFPPGASYGNPNLPGQLAGPQNVRLVPSAIPGSTRGVMKYFPFLTEEQRLFYQTESGNPFAYKHAIGQMAGPDSYAQNWLNDQYGEVRGRYINASTTNPALEFTDFLEKEMPSLAQRYAGLRGWERGEGAPTMGAGRAVYR